MNGTITPNIAKLPGVGMEATKPPLVENHCCRCSSRSLTLACCSLTKSCPTLCNPTDCSTPDFPVLHCLPEFAGRQMSPSKCPLSQWCLPTISPSVGPFPPALNLSRHQGLPQWVGSSHLVAKVLALQLNSCYYVFNYQPHMWIQTISQMWL